jgi:putative PIN family toxin of toxin-antitoxin system
VRAVLDTNVLISAFVFPGGTPEAVYRLALEGQLEIGTSRSLLAEFGRVLEQKFGWEPDRAEEAVTQMARIAIVVEPDVEVQVIVADPTDDRVLEAARAYDADVIVCGDRHLLDLASWSGVEIVAPAQSIASWGG